MKKVTILLTGAGGAGVISIIKSFKGKYRTIVTDTNPYAPGLYLADEGYIVPTSTEPNYLKEIEKIIKKEKVKVIVPLIDEELILISNYIKKNPHLMALLPRKKFIELCLDKWILSQKLSQKKIPFAKTYLLSNLASLSEVIFPCIIKPRTSRGSRGFSVINNEQDLNSYLSMSSYKIDELIIQELLKGKEFTVSVIVSKTGRVLSVVPKEVIIKKGVTQVAITRNSNAITNVAKIIQSTFNANGPFNMQLILSNDNKPMLFEINPRFSTTVSLTIEAGINEVEILIRDCLNLPFVINEFKKNLVMTRFYEQYYIDEKDTRN